MMLHEDFKFLSSYLRTSAVILYMLFQAERLNHSYVFQTHFAPLVIAHLTRNESISRDETKRLLFNCFMMEIPLSVTHTRLRRHIFFMSEYGRDRFSTPPLGWNVMKQQLWGRAPSSLFSLFRCLPVFLYDVDNCKRSGVVICLTCLWKCVKASLFLDSFTFDGHGHFRCLYHP